MNNPDLEIAETFSTSPLFYTRTRGLFRECFQGDKKYNAPKDGEISKFDPFKDVTPADGKNKWFLKTRGVGWRKKVTDLLFLK